LPPPARPAAFRSVEAKQKRAAAAIAASNVRNMAGLSDLGECFMALAIIYE